MRSCLMLAAQADGANLQTVEGLRNAESGELHPIQQAFIEVSTDCNVVSARRVFNEHTPSC